MKKVWIKNAIYTLVAILLMWAGWAIAYLFVNNELLIPSVSDTWQKVGELLTAASFYGVFWNTCARTLLSFCASLLLAMALSVASYFLSPVRWLLKPVIVFLRTVPTMAVILIFLIWTSPKVAPVLVTFLVSFPMLYATLLTALDSIGDNYRYLAKAYRFSASDKIFRVYLPLTAPVFLGEVGPQLSLALKVMVSAEVLCKTYQSLGGMMSEAKMFFEIPELFALTLLVVAVGILWEGVCFLLKKCIVRWH